MLLQEARKHLKESGKAYFPHLWYATKKAGLLIGMGVLSFVHGIFPNILQFTLPRMVIKLNKEVQDHYKDRQF